MSLVPMDLKIAYEWILVNHRPKNIDPKIARINVGEKI